MKSLRRPVPVAWAIPIVGVAFAGFLFLSDHAAARATETPPTVWTEKECLKCHPGAAGLELIRAKRDDPSYCKGLSTSVEATSAGLSPLKPSSTGHKSY